MGVAQYIVREFKELDDVILPGDGLDQDKEYVLRYVSDNFLLVEFEVAEQSDLAIGDPIEGATVGRVLFVGQSFGGPTLEQSPGLSFNNATSVLSVTGGLATPFGTVTAASVNASDTVTAASVTSPTMRGSVASGGALAIDSTSHATKGTIAIGGNLYVNQVNGRIGIGKAVPDRVVHIDANDFMRADRQNSGVGASWLLTRRGALTIQSSWVVGPSGLNTGIDDFSIVDYGVEVTGFTGDPRIVATKTTGNVALCWAGSFGGGSRVVSLPNATTVPTSNPSGGGILYVQNGALKYRGPGGTVTEIAPP